MPNEPLRIEGLDELMNALNRFPQEVHSGMMAGMGGAIEIVREGLATYPPRRYGAKAAFVSDKHRRGFFAKLRAGEIDVPYKRGVSPGSERLGASWTTEVKSFGPTNIKGIAGTRASYVQLVQGPQQTAMHATTGWKTVEQVLKETRAEVERFLGRVVEKILARIAARG